MPAASPAENPPCTGTCWSHGQFNLGLLYIRGAGVGKDDVEAYRWLTLAHQGGRSDALSVRDSIAGRMTPEQLARARALARGWKPARAAP